MITKESFMYWADELNEEIIRLGHVSNYIKRLYYLEDKITSDLHEDLDDKVDFEIEKRMIITDFIMNAIDVIDGFKHTPIGTLSVTHSRINEDIQTEINSILDTESSISFNK
jgi:hypothetical protein